MLFQIALTMTKGIGISTIRNLMSYCVSAEEVYTTPRSQLEKIPGISARVASAITQKSGFGRAEEELLFIEKSKINPLFLTDPRYPKRLRQCVDAPPLLYFKGNSDLNQMKVIAVVGTRNATAYGREFCESLMERFKAHQVLVVSGLAYGIDITAHKVALYHQLETVGVLGHGLDTLYPATHRAVAEKMLTQGGLLTEFPSTTTPERQNFPKRNRIIAGMADATIVVEATRNGGALITAEIANSYNRDVFAVPGRVQDEFSEGCNFLIKTHRANMVTLAADIEYIMGWSDPEPKAAQKQLLLMPELTDEESKIYTLIKNSENIAIDNLQIKLNMPVSQLTMQLLNLEMKTLIVSLPGKVYKAI